MQTIVHDSLGCQNGCCERSYENFPEVFIAHKLDTSAWASNCRASVAGCVNLTVTTVGVYSLYSCWTAVGHATWFLHSEVNFMAVTCWRTCNTAEEAARMLSNEISDEDDLDDLFTVDNLHGQDEEYGDPNGESTTDRSDFEESTPSTSQVSASIVSSGERLTGSVLPSSPLKRSRRSDRLVTGINAVLETDNFEKMDLPPANRKTCTGYLGQRKKKDTEKILWTDAQPDARGRQRQCDIIRVAPGLKSREVKSVETIREAFEFFSEEMMDLVVSSTNLKIQQTLSKQPREALKDDTKPYLHPTDRCELQAVIGLMYFCGLLGLNNHSVHHIFSERTCLVGQCRACILGVKRYDQ